MPSIDMSNDSEKCDQTTVCSEKHLVEMEDGPKEFAKFYKNWCPGRFLRMTNWLLLITFLITSIYGAAKPLWWDHIRDWGRMPTAIGLCLTLLVLSKLCRRRQCAKSVESMGVMDLCFALITALTMVVVGGFYVAQFVEVYGHFGPKLHKGAILAELTDMDDPYNRIPPIYVPYNARYSHEYEASYPDTDVYLRRRDRTTTTTTTTVRPYSQHEVEVMESRRKHLLFTLFLLVPTNIALALSAVLVNLMIALSLWIALKRAAKLRTSIPIPTSSSEFDAKYSHFWPYGWASIATWLIPLLALLLSIFAGAITRGLPVPILLAIAFAVTFAGFIKYCEKVNVMRNSTEMSPNSEQPQLMPMCITHIVLSVVGLVIYLVSKFNLPYYIRDEGFYFCMAGLAASSLQLLLLLGLLFGHSCRSGGSTYFGLPQISIQISVNVNKNQREEVEKKDETEGQESGKVEKTEPNHVI